jgi:hypothetical protein
MRQQIAELDRKVKAQVQALERGIEPELVSERIGELRGEKEALERPWPGSAASVRKLRTRSWPTGSPGSLT